MLTNFHLPPTQEGCQPRSVIPTKKKPGMAHMSCHSRGERQGWDKTETNILGGGRRVGVGGGWWEEGMGSERALWDRARRRPA